ncbi:protein Mdm4 isoform X2 [Aethina tumida]|uniref:protein Mdm4 isoform X2 n=1 Tax=Aethina tumida TaxID=116153 RepID=UPI00096AE323|nr:protein Mdm4 isoform X2 [Aethina tumida]
MSTVAENNASRKRSLDLEGLSVMDLKRPRAYYYRLASESSRGSAEDDTESVDSLQDKETDVIQDTTDTDTKSDCSSNKDEYEVEIEYEVASLSEEENYSSCSSTGSEDMMMAAAAVAAVIYDTSLEARATDSEDSDSSSIDTTLRSFSTCVQCKFENNNPLYRYCEKCFQERKKYFPPRPKGFRRRKKQEEKPPEAPVKLDTLRSCLNGLSQFSQDSGIGSSQECPQLDLDRIVVPSYHLTTQGTSSSSIKSGVSEESAKGTGSDLNGYVDMGGAPKQGYKRSLSELQSESEPELKRTKRADVEEIGTDGNADVVSDGELRRNIAESEASNLCLFCNSAPKDSIFLHTNIAHMCCCYKCAKKTFNTTRRCPICNGTVNKVVKIFMS